MREYIVVTKDSMVHDWFGRPSKRRFPHVDKDGMVNLNNRKYVVDSRRFMRYTFRPKRYLGLIEKEVQMQIWIANDPDPLDLAHIRDGNGSPSITSDLIAQYARSQHLQRLVQPETNWMMLLLILSIVANLAMVGVVYSMSQG